MADDLYIAFAATYSRVDRAIRSYDDITDFYRVAGLDELFDAAVIAKDENGTVTIVAQREETRRLGALAGAGVGLALGVVVALFPGIIVPGALLVGTTGGAGVGALAGHVRGGLSHRALRDLGDLLQRGQAGLVAVAQVDVAPELRKSIRGADRVLERELRSDHRRLEKVVDEAIRDARSSS